MDTYFDTRSSKFTRGEKCIFVHLIITFVLILASTTIYIAHIYKVNHPEITVPDYLPIGVLYLNISYLRPICNTIHLRERWSVAPAHCVIIRSEPDMAQWLSEWRIKYRSISLKFVVTHVIRSIAHPHFNREDFSNNIGLLEHAYPVSIHQYTSFGKAIITSNFTDIQENGLRIGEWAQLSTDQEGQCEGISYEFDFVLFSQYKDGRETLFVLHRVSSLEWARCYNYMAPVVDIRSYEFCVTVSKSVSVNLYHGAALFRGNDVVGFFSWGERRRRTFPLIILQIADFKGWIQKQLA